MTSLAGTDWRQLQVQNTARLHNFSPNLNTTRWPPHFGTTSDRNPTDCTDEFHSEPHRPKTRAIFLPRLTAICCYRFLEGVCVCRLVADWRFSSHLFLFSSSHANSHRQAGARLANTHSTGEDLYTVNTAPKNGSQRKPTFWWLKINENFAFVLFLTKSMIDTITFSAFKKNALKLIKN